MESLMFSAVAYCFTVLRRLRYDGDIKLTIKPRSHSFEQVNINQKIQNFKNIMKTFIREICCTYMVREVIDITLVTSNIDLYLCKWRVSDDDSLSDHKYIEFRITTELQPIPSWRNPRATRWDAYIADLEEAMGGRIRGIWTEEDIENEVAFIQESIDTSYKNNCKERKYYPKKGAPWWYPELDKMRKICRSNF